MKNCKLLMMIAIALIFCVHDIRTSAPIDQHVAVQNANEFDRLIKKYPYAVVLFSGNDAKGKLFTRVLGDASNKRRYRDMNVVFILVDSSLKDIMQEYKAHDLPVFMLFIDGALVRTDSNKTAVLRGDEIGFYDLKEFIDTFFVSSSDDTSDTEYVVERPERIVVSKPYYKRTYYRPYYYGYPYWGGYYGGYPYWYPYSGVGFGYYGRRGGFGFGIGF